jgi:hypothetical protein
VILSDKSGKSTKSAVQTMEEYKYKDITGGIIGAAMQVHKILGNAVYIYLFKNCIYEFKIC